MKIATCQRCGVEFAYEDRLKKYCSTRCARGAPEAPAVTQDKVLGLIWRKALGRPEIRAIKKASEERKMKA